MARLLSLTVAFLFLFFLRKADSAWFFSKCTISKAWSEWSDCSKSCGWGSRSRSQRGNKYCKASQLKQTEDCNKHSCAVDCAWANWGQWAKCSVTCASGKTTRRRIVVSREKHGGKKCLPSAASETKTCKLKPCPIHCAWNIWGRWGKCSTTCGLGRKNRKRFKARQRKYGGKLCPGKDWQTTKCKTRNCPVNCAWSIWGRWGKCSATCGLGKRTRKRGTARQQKYGGKRCPGKDWQTTKCKTRNCPVNCAWSIWGRWGKCSATCGLGKKTRKRGKTRQQKYGGKRCPGKDWQTTKCKTRNCPVNCTWSIWGRWGKCSATCGLGRKTRKRGKARQRKYGGKRCPGKDWQTTKCKIRNCPVNCVCGTIVHSLSDAPCTHRYCAWSIWGRWGKCSATCGLGKKTRKRGKARQRKYGGKRCPGKDWQTTKCKTRNCPVNCTWSIWGRWGKCSATCGLGRKTRKRGKARQQKYGGKRCPEKDWQTTMCKTRNCPVNCAWSIWGQWGKCSATCGLGGKTRKRGKARQRKYGGKRCPGKDWQTTMCKTRNCPVNCTWSIWGRWGKCSATCGLGRKTRKRGKARQRKYGGKRCPGKDWQTTKCKIRNCPVNCVCGTIVHSLSDAPCTHRSTTFLPSISSSVVGISPAQAYGATNKVLSKSQSTSTQSPAGPITTIDKQSTTSILIPGTILAVTAERVQKLSTNTVKESITTMETGDTTKTYTQPTKYRRMRKATKKFQKLSTTTPNFALTTTAIQTSETTTFLPSISSTAVGISPGQAHGTTYNVLGKSQSTSTQSPAGPITTIDKQSTTSVLIPGTTVAVTAERVQKLSTNTVKEPMTTMETSDTTKTYTQPTKYRRMRKATKKFQKLPTTTPNFAITTTAIQTPERIIHKQPTAGPKIHRTVQGIQETPTTTANVSTLRTSIGLPGTTKLSKPPEAYTKKHMITKKTPGRSNFILTTSQFTTATTSAVSTQKTTKSTIMANFVSTTPIFPLSDVEAVIVTTVQSLGCTIILISLAVTLAVFLILRDFSYERFLHMNMEVALFLGHILVLTMRDITNMPTLCKIAGVGFQFFFLASFCFMLLEALQAYAIRTNVISYGGYCSRLQSFVIGWGMSAVITVVTAVIRHQEYVSDWSCWLNLGSSVVYASTGPVLILSAVTIITAEASGMGNYTALPDRNQDQFTAANANAKALFLILPLSTASWFVGLYAVYHANIALYSVVHALNVALGISIFAFHSLGNPKTQAEEHQK